MNRDAGFGRFGPARVPIDSAQWSMFQASQFVYREWVVQGVCLDPVSGGVGRVAVESSCKWLESCR